jgi:triosephosphate isomerase
MRKPIVAGNWKMHGTLSSSKILAEQIIEQGNPSDDIDVILSPPAIFIPAVKTILANNKVNITLAGQNCYDKANGAYTGEIAPEMLQEFGCEYVILGHSERRQIFAETDELVANKCCFAYHSGLKPILCVGETQQQRQLGQTQEVIESQLLAVLDKLPANALSKLVVAYEPVWAIGTGVAASPEQAQSVHADIRAVLMQKNADLAGETRILYGGSIKPDNARALFMQADIDGGLIGGASLKANDFIKICHHAMTG